MSEIEKRVAACVDKAIDTWTNGEWEFRPVLTDHIAEALADAGLVPGQQEWGVEYRAWTGAIYTEPAPRDEAERIVANDDTANLMTRWSGATAWTAEEETK